MKNFGIAFGAITATVIGGALLLDLSTDAPEKTASNLTTKPSLATTPSGVTESTTSPPTVPSANGSSEAPAMIKDPRTSVDEASSRKPAGVSSTENSGKATRSSSKGSAATSVSIPSNGELAQRSAPSTPGPAQTKSAVDPASSTAVKAANTNTTVSDQPRVEQPQISVTEAPTAPPTATSTTSAASSSASIKEGEQSDVANTTK